MDFLNTINENFESFIDSNPIFEMPVKLIAFYLPQFHCIPENDIWWGKGFTEWTNTSKASKLFCDHYQPRVPSYLGYYNLTDINIYHKQVELAKAAGIYGFCFYFYWFNGKTLLERPIEIMLNSTSIQQPFCLCWANENWTRAWDGLENDVLITQNYSQQDIISFLNHIDKYFKDERYIKIDGRPVLIIYRPYSIPNIKHFQDIIRTYVINELGYPDIYLVGIQAFENKDPNKIGFDAALQFPPHHRSNESNLKDEHPHLIEQYNGKFVDYNKLQNDFCKIISPEYKLFRGLTLNWDNTPRRKERFLIMKNFSMTAYAKWLFNAIKLTIDDVNLNRQEKFIFINAWNEWAEGTYLEPDKKYGFGYLNSTKKVLLSYAQKKPRVTVIIPNYNHALYIEKRIESIIYQTYKPYEIIFLDDASSDKSIDLAKGMLSKSNIKFEIIRNEENSRNVFKQWLRGIELSSGDLIWIAESDDDASLDFLEKIISCFEKEHVMLAYGQMSYINSNGSMNKDLSEYYSDLKGFDWSQSHIMSSYMAFNGPFAVKNLVPNASGAVFRKPLLTSHEKERLTSYSYAGDWYLYLIITRGGSIAFCKEAKSYFRKHEKSVSQKSLFTDVHIKEHNMIIQDIIDVYGIKSDIVDAHLQMLIKVLRINQPAITIDEIKGFINVQVRKSKEINICIASYGFSVGGGEMAPIDLANILREKGHHITFLVMHRKLKNDPPILRKRLKRNIPVIYLDEVKHNFNRFLLEYGIDVFNSHNVMFELFFHKENIRLNIPYISSLHGGYETLSQPLKKDFSDYIISTVNVWLYLAKKNIQPILESGAVNGEFLQSFNIPSVQKIDYKFEINLRECFSSDKTSIFLCIASRALASKGWVEAIEITKKLNEICKNNYYHLFLIGDGPDLYTIKSNSSMHRFVTFLGRVNNIYHVLRQCDIGVFPSLYSGESFPLFILECLSLGKPVIATDIGAIPYIFGNNIHDMPGKIVNKDQSKLDIINEMVSWILKISNNKKYFNNAKENTTKIAKSFTKNKLTEFYLNIIYGQIGTRESIFRNPNALCRTNCEAGKTDYGQELFDSFYITGHIHPKLMKEHKLNQIVVLDASNRYITGANSDSLGKWSLKINKSCIGSDKKSLRLEIFATNSHSKYIFPLSIPTDVQSNYENYLNKLLS